MGQKSHLTPQVVLVAEDELLLRMSAADLLEREGYEVVEAGNATEAIRILEGRDDVRILFTDIQMPGGLDGLALAKLVHERWPEVLLLVTSGGVQVTDEELPDHGRFLPKPYGSDDLLTKLQNLSHR